MSEMVRTETLFRGSDEAPELEDYRPISPLAIIACVACLASVLAIAHPLLWIIPAVAVVLSVCAIVRISAAQSRYGGRGVAVAALCFAVLIGTYAPARSLSRERVLYEQAQSEVEAWLAILQQGRVHEAHQLSLRPGERFQGPGSLASHYGVVPTPPRSSTSSPADNLETPVPIPSSVEALHTFLAEPAVAKLLEFGEQSRFEHIENVGMRFESGELTLTLRYRATHMQGDQPESFEFLIRASRRELEKFADWSVGKLELAR